jgi:WD40 repeat protein
VVRLWDAATGVPIGKPLAVHAGALLAVAVSPDDREIVAAGVDGSIRRWVAETGVSIGAPMVVSTQPLMAVVFASDSREVAIGGADGIVYRWDVATGSPIDEPLVTRAGAVLAMPISPDGSYIMTANANGTARCWETKTRTPLAPQVDVSTSRFDTVAAAAFSPDTLRIAVVAYEGHIAISDTNSGELVTLIGVARQAFVFRYSSIRGCALTNGAERDCATSR